MKMRKGSAADRIRKLEKRTALRLKQERRKKRRKKGINLVVPEGGQAFGVQFKSSWKEEEE